MGFWFVLTLLYLLTFDGINCVQHNSSQSTLRLVQLIHTYGDRTPSSFVHNDPFSDVQTFWPEGIGQLTNFGMSSIVLSIGVWFIWPC